ncbi:hypothetical protein GN956_G9557 [Arapaima gigas]
MELSRSLLTSLLLILPPLSCSELPPSCKKSHTLVILATLRNKADLPCSFLLPHQEASQFRMRWLHYPAGTAKPEVILFWPKSSQVPVEDRRALFSWNEKGLKTGNFSLSLQMVKEDDAGLYRCIVWRGWDCEMVTNVTLKVTECQVLDPVTAPPGTSVFLPCPFGPTAEKIQNISVRWQLLKGKQKTLILQHPEPGSVDLQDELLRGRIRFSGRPQLGEFALNVSNLMDTDTNWYRCEQQMQRSQICYETRLEVREYQPVAATTPGMTTLMWNQTDSAPTETVRGKASPGNGSLVVSMSLLVSTGVIALAAGLLVYVKWRRGSRRSKPFDDPQETPYSNVEFQPSVPSTCYSLAYSKEYSCGAEQSP